MHFGENQLSPGSIGISPLATGHPPVLQHRWVRASTRSHPRFTLPMASSPGFGPAAGDHRSPCSDSLSLRLRGASRRLTWTLARSHAPAAPPTPTRRIILQKARRHPAAGRPKTPPPHLGLRLLAGAGVQALFHPPRGVLFTLPSRYSCAIGGRGYSSLGGWSPPLPTGFPVSRGTRARRPGCPAHPPPTGLSPPAVARSSAFGRMCSAPLDLATPHNPAGPEGPAVWAAARLARHYYGPLPPPDQGGWGHPSRDVLLISPPRGTQMFHFPRCPPAGLCIRPPVRALSRPRVAPFGSGRLIARLQLPAHVSPRAASFLGPLPPRHPPRTLTSLALLRINQAFARLCRASIHTV
jgi:hypothetical protein